MRNISHTCHLGRNVWAGWQLECSCRQQCPSRRKMANIHLVNAEWTSRMNSFEEIWSKKHPHETEKDSRLEALGNLQPWAYQYTHFMFSYVHVSLSLSMYIYIYLCTFISYSCDSPSTKPSNIITSNLHRCAWPERSHVTSGGRIFWATKSSVLGDFPLRPAPG